MKRSEIDVVRVVFSKEKDYGRRCINMVYSNENRGIIMVKDKNMKNILVIGLLACAMLGLTACKDPDNQTSDLIIPEKYQGKWYSTSEDTEELVCEIFSDRISFYYFNPQYGEKTVNHFVGKSFEINSVDEMGLIFNFPAIEKGQRGLYARLRANYLEVWVNVKDSPVDYLMTLENEAHFVTAAFRGDWYSIHYYVYQENGIIDFELLQQDIYTQPKLLFEVNKNSLDLRIYTRQKYPGWTDDMSFNFIQTNVSNDFLKEILFKSKNGSDTIVMRLYIQTRAVGFRINDGDVYGTATSDTFFQIDLSK